MHLFAQRGYEGTTNRAIADGCGLTGAAIYHYFDSKAELYAAVYEAVFARVFDELMQTVIHTALFSGFCYTQFADTFQESNGLLNADRTPKIPLEQIRKSTNGARQHIACGV